MWKTFTRLALAASVALTVASAGAPAYAQRRSPTEHAARIAFTTGLHLRDVEHKPEKALEKLLTAHKLAATPRTAYELGRTYMLLGDWLAAQRLFVEVGRMPPDPLQTPRGKAARKESKRLEGELEDRIPAIAFELTGSSTSRRPGVAVDGVAVPPDALSLPWKVNPGTHTVTFKVAGGADQTKTLAVSEGTTERVTIDVGPARASTTTPRWTLSPTPEQPASGSNKAVALAFGGAGLALVGTGAALALSAKVMFDDAKQNDCGRAIGAASDQQCTAQGVNERRAAGSRSDIATMLFGVGIVAVGTGVALWIHPDSSRDVRVGVAANGIVLAGGF
jgi:hypothetical protein